VDLRDADLLHCPSIFPRWCIQLVPRAALARRDVQNQADCWCWCVFVRRHKALGRANETQLKSIWQPDDTSPKLKLCSHATIPTGLN
jgi:hypothetical protein